jgi:hypothetical protein
MMTYDGNSKTLGAIHNEILSNMVHHEEVLGSDMENIATSALIHFQTAYADVLRR